MTTDLRATCPTQKLTFLVLRLVSAYIIAVISPNDYIFMSDKLYNAFGRLETIAFKINGDGILKSSIHY